MENEKIFKGVKASEGDIKAQAFVIKDLTNLPEAPDYDYILVAPYTTPILNLYISNAKGIICEMGGITCHAAIIAREFGIPCLVGVQGIILQVENGQNIEIVNDQVKI